MAEGICLSYRSWLAEHRHVLWIENTASLPQVPEPVDEAVRVYPIAMFNQALAPLQRGRFYPARILNSNESLPGPLMRVIDLDDNQFTADFNHPLAGRECTFCSETCISHAAVSGEPAELLSWAGIDTPLADDEVDYADSGALARDDETADAGFYTTPRKLLHVDGVCAGRIAAFYAEHLTAADRVLDLMAGWRSQLDDFAGDVNGLGMNAEEMADNPALQSCLVHDLNASPIVPFADASFAAAVNTVSIEYLTRPLAVLEEVKRILKPGGKLLITFSNRFFPPKAVALWKYLHPAERLNWVAQTVHAAGFTDIKTRVERGLQRDTADPYYPQLREMDPLFAIVADKPA